MFGVSLDNENQWIGWPCAAFFAFATVKLMTRLRDDSVQIRINATGIQSREWSEEWIAWREIAEVKVWQYKGQKSIVLVLHHPERFRSVKQGKMSRLANRGLTGGDAWITLAGKDRSFDEAMAAIDCFRAPVTRDGRMT